jgi:phospholipid/cholesterol/gamma-HCH transport system permease protein
MMPLLTLYANVIGILSGWIVAEGLMGVPGPVYFNEMQYIVGIEDFLLGIFKACVFGVLVSTAGCIRGLQCGSGADAVGVAATRAVVAGITLIVFSNAVIDWAAATLGI